MKTILKCLAWLVIVLAISLAMVYGFWLILIFWLFGETLFLSLTIAGELALLAIWIVLVRIAEC
jgi:hypothetical protein